VSVKLARMEEATVETRRNWERGAFLKPDVSIVISSVVIVFEVSSLLNVVWVGG
jgi:hypothetical protein